MKKILLLGGSEQQLIAIKTAKHLGYYTVLCDYLDDNPGQFVCDKFYLASTTDINTILKISEQEQISGILAYATDPAAPTAAYIAEKLNLPTIPFNSVNILCNKHLFRDFLKQNNFNYPKSISLKTSVFDINILNDFSFPLIIKPIDSSGSKGVSVLNNLENIDNAISYAFSFSRSHEIIIEEFITKKHKYLIGGDIFVINGKIELWGLMNCHRDSNVNTLVPIGKSYPAYLQKDDLIEVKKTLNEIVSKLNITTGAINVELLIDKNNKVYPIDMGPRCGGNMIPDLMQYIFETNIVELSIKAAMGEPISIISHTNNFYYATHNLHTNKNGILRNISFSSKLDRYIIKKCIYKKIGDKVEFFQNASKVLGIIFLKFANNQEMQDILESINSYINIEIE